MTDNVRTRLREALLAVQRDDTEAYCWCRMHPSMYTNGHTEACRQARAAVLDTEGDRPASQKIAELEWVLARAEDIVAYEHGKDAAYAFTQAWGELPKELATPRADTEGDASPAPPHEHRFQGYEVCSECGRTEAAIAGCHHCTEVTPGKRCWWCLTLKPALPDPPVQP